MKIIIHILSLFVLLTVFQPALGAKELNINPPLFPAKLIFIHHSCGENWLNDGDGGLGRALLKNNYFVSDTNYGWGPSNIGDRTDIVNWTEWFSSFKSNKYMKALLNENKRHSSYARNISDPGGKNKIVMFKSCFPNSEIKGNPEDSPEIGGELTIANAKDSYIKILSYFAKHPETLFIAITAPPVQDARLSKNARAFNNWLIYEWLKNYKGYNVGVYDFYNTLTGIDNHHHIDKNTIVHVYKEGSNTLHYGSIGDDHPLTEGNKKAVKEFVPLLNMFYNSWKQRKPYITPKRIVLVKNNKSKQSKQKSTLVQFGGESKTCELGLRKGIPSKKIPVSNIADFEDGCSKWTVFSDSNPGTQIKFVCEAKKQANVLKIEYKVATEGWGTCSLVYRVPLSFKGKKGISFDLLAKDTGENFNFIVYQGKASDDLHHFEININTDRKMVSNWQKIQIPFSKLKRPAWEGSPDERIDLNFIQGVAFGFNGESNSEKSIIWIDNIKLY